MCVCCCCCCLFWFIRMQEWTRLSREEELQKKATAAQKWSGRLISLDTRCRLRPVCTVDERTCNTQRRCSQPASSSRIVIGCSREQSDAPFSALSEFSLVYPIARNSSPWLTFVRCPDVKRRYPGGARRWHSVGRALSTRGGSGTARAAATVAVGHPGARGPRTATAMRCWCGRRADDFSHRVRAGECVMCGVWRSVAAAAGRRAHGLAQTGAMRGRSVRARPESMSTTGCALAGAPLQRARRIGAAILGECPVRPSAERRHLSRTPESRKLPFIISINILFPELVNDIRGKPKFNPLY